MKLNLIFAAFFLLLVSLTHAQVANTDADTTYWQKGGLGTLNFSQVALSNWAAGGQSTIAINGFVGLFGDYRRNRSTWQNTVEIGYGLIRQWSQDESPEDKNFVKSDDRLYFSSMYGYQISEKNDRWFLSVLMDFKTQFAPGYVTEAQDSLISKFMAPGYLTLGLGIDYKPNDVFYINYMPLSGKFTFVNDDKLADLGAYGVDPGHKFRAELGSFLRTRYKQEIFENVTVESRLELFTNYMVDFGVIDVNWQNSVTMEINDFLAVNYYLQLIYDEDIEIKENGDPATQLKSVLGIGLAHRVGYQRKKEE